jgi:UDP-galactopyranose mutase
MRIISEYLQSEKYHQRRVLILKARMHLGGNCIYLAALRNGVSKTVGAGIDGASDAECIT